MRTLMTGVASSFSDISKLPLVYLICHRFGYHLPISISVHGWYNHVNIYSLSHRFLYRFEVQLLMAYINTAQISNMIDREPLSNSLTAIFLFLLEYLRHQKPLKISAAGIIRVHTQNWSILKHLNWYCSSDVSAENIIHLIYAMITASRVNIE